MKTQVFVLPIVFLGVMIALTGCPDPSSSKSDRDTTFGDKDILFGTYQTNGEIHRMTADGDGIETVITNGIYPRVSQNETKIVYESYVDGDYEIWIADIDGTNAQQLTDNTAEDRRPFFSPDGGTILFESDRNGNTDLFTMTTNGGNVTQITTSTNDEKRAEFSPDGSQIVFVGYENGIKQIFTINRDGTGAKQILSTGYDCFQPFWIW